MSSFSSAKSDALEFRAEPSVTAVIELPVLVVVLSLSLPVTLLYCSTKVGMRLSHPTPADPEPDLGSVLPADAALASALCRSILLLAALIPHISAIVRHTRK